ncbi:hypothetical protein ES705_49731 [subsurface metagenome]
MRKYEVEKAKNYAIIAEKLDKSNIWYKAHLANIYQFENNFDSAAALYEEILMERNDVETKYNLALLYSQAQKNEKAIKILDELEEEFRGSRKVYLMKHNIYHNMREYDSAIVELESLVKYFPDDVNNYGILAEYLAEIGRNTFAKEIYQDIIDHDSLNGLAILSYADFFMKNNEVDSAFTYYNRALCCSNLELNDKIAVIVNFIGAKPLLEKYNEEVLKLLEIIAMDYKDYRIYASFSDIHIHLQQYDKAVPYLDSAIMYEKNNQLLWEQAIFWEITVKL